jgi:hypothetical protein
MKLSDYKLIFAAVCLIGVLLIASPALGTAFRFPEGEQFSELYLLGPGHMAENYPHNIVVGVDYSIFVGVGNHLGSSAYYEVQVKLLSMADSLPNSTAGIPSPVQPLYQYRLLLGDNGTWESPLTFSVANASVNRVQATINKLSINGVNFNVNKSVSWDTNSTSFPFVLLCELWLCNGSANSMRFHERYVDLKLNITNM